MFSLLYGFWEYVFRKEEFRILLVGLDKAGKTNILEKLKTLYSGSPGLEADKILPTVGLNVARLEAFRVQLMIWDLGGQTGLRSIWDKYYADSHALVFVVDAAAPQRLEEAKAALDKALGSRELFGAPLLIAANKQDVEHALPATEISSRLGLSGVDTRPCKVLETSSVDDLGISDSVQWLVEAAKASDRALMLRKRLAAR